MPFGFNLPDVSSMYSIGLILLSTLFFVGVAVLILFWINNRRKFGQYNILIFEFNKDGDWVFTEADRGGVFYDNYTKNKLLFLKKNKVGLNPDKMPAPGYYNGKKTLLLFKAGQKNFHYINPKIRFDRLTLSVGEEDVNWAENAYERGIKMISAPDRLTQLLPYIIWALVIIGTLILMIQLLKKVDVIKDVMITAKEIAQINAQALTGTTVMPGVGG